MLEAILLAFYFLLVALQSLFMVAITTWIVGAVALALVIYYAVRIFSNDRWTNRRV